MFAASLFWGLSLQTGCSRPTVPHYTTLRVACWSFEARQLGYSRSQLEFMFFLIIRRISEILPFNSVSFLLEGMWLTSVISHLSSLALYLPPLLASHPTFTLESSSENFSSASHSRSFPCRGRGKQQNV